MPVCIAGMHRSGTSMVARLLHLCGLYLGQDDDLKHGSANNPEGFWENVKLLKVNEDILGELGSAWDCPPPAMGGWSEEGLTRLRAKAGVVLQEFQGREPWGWKDPRSSITFPFWAELLPDTKVVICLRNPLEVTLSLNRRNLSSYVLGLKLWRMYNEQILEATSREQRLVTHYDAFFSDPQAELRRILDFVGLSASDELIQQVCSAAQVDLRHHRFTTQHLVDANVSLDVIKLYLELSAEAGWMEDSGERWAPAEPVAGTVRAATPSGANGSAGRELAGGGETAALDRAALPSVSVVDVGRLNRWVVDLERLRAHRVQLEEQINALGKEIQAHKKEIGTLTKERDELRRENTWLHEENGSIREKYASVGAKFGALREEMTRANKTIEQMKATHAWRAHARIQGMRERVGKKVRSKTGHAPAGPGDGTGA